MIQIIPTILVKNFKEFKKKVKLLEQDFSLAQIDVMDGKFVKNITFFEIEKIEKIKTSLKYELHLMGKNPLYYLKKLREAGGGLQKKVKKILFHCETAVDVKEISEEIRSLGMLSGVVANPETDIEKIMDAASRVDAIMLMGVHPGASGQKFIPETVDRVKAVRAFHPTIDIEIDGGVNDKTAKALVEAGANILAVGSFMYQGKPAEQREKILKSII